MKPNLKDATEGAQEVKTALLQENSNLTVDQLEETADVDTGAKAGA
jgi:hypothetical protein